jgi:hypothetical protein
MVPLKMVVNPLGDMVYWLFPLMSLAAAIVCLLFRRVSGRLLIVMAAFLLDGLLFMAMRFAVMLEVDGSLNTGRFAELAMYSNVARAAIGLLLVVGLAVTFADVQRKLKQARNGASTHGATGPNSYPDHDAG